MNLQKKSNSLPANVLADRVVQRLMEAEKALGHAVGIDQVKLVMDAAAAQQVFAHRRKLGKHVEDFAYSIASRALAKLGSLIAAAQEAGQIRKRGRVGKSSTAELLQSLQIDKKTSAIAKQLAALPDDTREAIHQREFTLTEARRKQKREQQPQDLQLPSGKFRVLYADPPWSYGNAGVIGESDNYGRAARHYPSMTIAQLCEMDVKARAADDAVLFLWVTSPLLDECWPVIKAWGFTYKTSMVWDKVKHNYGSYVSVRHELLLICTRGSCLPDRPLSRRQHLALWCRELSRVLRVFDTHIANLSRAIRRYFVCVETDRYESRLHLAAAASG